MAPRGVFGRLAEIATNTKRQRSCSAAAPGDDSALRREPGAEVAQQNGYKP